uniref:SH3 and multiple ankyrin repeat domains protein 3-like n=1 Tax=Phallusia mammillata TaxID=59560 RepID=A0A6F9DSA3_9ASCI|nr:SH3 and multiple ankyrin repeat domains protein 3-like [Phallusia mammillata]
MSSFVGMRSATSELDISRNYNNNVTGARLLRQKSNTSLRNISMFSRTDKPIDDCTRQATSTDAEWESRHRRLTNVNSNNNHSLRSIATTVPQSPDYRTLLMMRRPMSKVPRRYSDYDSCDSNESDDEYPDELPDNGETACVSRASNASTNSNTSQGSLIIDSPLPHLLNDEHEAPEPDKFLTDAGSSDNRVLLKISVTEQKLTKCLRVDISETAWTAKQRIIQTLAKKLLDPFNYGLYCKKLGRFLLDHKPLSEYVEAGSVAAYELRYKRRVFHQIMRSPKESRQLLKMQSSSKRKELMTHVRQRNTDKIHTMIRKGVDPNFHASSSEETPLTLASIATANSEGGFDRSCSPVIMALVGGGAHLDFRNRKGMTPVHAAARSGNLSALKTLLDLGASPDVIDNRDLSPVYHCGLIGSRVECLIVLLQNGADLSCVDSQGWTILHQVCRYGRLAHLKAILESVDQNSLDGTAALVNARNATGNTPLHICALYNEEMCLRTLFKHGADSSLPNYANQDACQVAVVAGNVELAKLIQKLAEEPPTNDDNEGKSASRVASGESVLARLDSSALAPPVDDPTSVFQPQEYHTTTDGQDLSVQRPTTLQLSPTKDRELPPYPTVSTNHTLRSPSRDTSRPVALTVVRQLSDATPRIDGDSGRVEVLNSNDQYDLLFIACQDYVAQNPREISLTIGDLVTVSSDGGIYQVEGYCCGKVGSDVGIFPLDCVQAVKLRRSKPSYGGTLSAAETNKNSSSKISELSEENVMRQQNSTSSLSASNISNPMISTSNPDVFHQIFDVVLKKGADGYGFVLRGAKSEGPIEKFAATPEYPALQYLESVENGSNAHRVGLRAGHYILKINDKDVSCIGHRQIVDTIRCAGDPLRMRVANVVVRNEHQNGKEKGSVSDDVRSEASCSTGSSIDLPFTTSPKHKHNPSTSSVGGDRLSRSGSIGSAIGKLDSVLALEEISDVSDPDDNKHTATLRRRPVSRRVRTQELQEIFRRQEILIRAGNPPQAVRPRESQSLSAATSQKLIRVLPPKLPAGQNAESDVVVEDMSRNGSTSPVHPATVALHQHNPKPHVASTFGHNKYMDNNHTEHTNSQPRTIGPSHSLNRQTSTPVLSVTSRKPPPAPPQRRNSKLTGSIREDPTQKSGTSAPPVSGTSFARTPSPSPTTTHPQSFGSVRTTPVIKQPLRPEMSGFAAAIAAAAQRRTSDSSQDGGIPTATTPTGHKGPSVAPKPKPERKPEVTQPKVNKTVEQQPPPVSSSPSPALALALAAKKATAQQTSAASSGGKVESTNLVKPSSFSNALRRASGEEKRSEALQRSGTPVTLPPPPPTPPSDTGGKSPNYILPPPPTYEHHDTPNSSNYDQMLSLPPPPDAMLNSPSPSDIPPPSAFTGSLPPPSAPSKFKDQSNHSAISSEGYTNTSVNGVDSVSNADSGVDDIGPARHMHNDGKTNIETISVVSSHSTISSEDGSDVGVSLCYDSKPNTESNGTSGNMYLDVLRKNKHSSEAPSKTVAGLTKVQFGGLPTPATHPKPAKPAVEKTPPQNEVSQSEPAKVTPAAPPVAVTEAKPAAKPSYEGKSVTSWTVDEVSAWLQDLGLGQYVDAFAENEIDGSHLPELGKDELQELGIKRMGHRLSIERSLKKLGQ